MIDTDVRDFGNDNEMVIECAFNFPAILYVFGAKKWPILSKVFQKLVTHKDKVYKYLKLESEDAIGE